MGVRDLFDANAEILLNADSGLSDEWVYTPPGADPQTISGDWLFDEEYASEGRQVLDQGDEIHDYGLLDLPLSIVIDIAGSFRRVSDNSTWNIKGIVSRDMQLQTVRLCKPKILSTRKFNRRGI